MAAPSVLTPILKRCAGGVDTTPVGSRAVRNIAWGGASLAGLAVASLFGLRAQDWGWGDYTTEASPAFHALIQGHVGRFLQLAPGYGGSLILRAPFVLLAHAVGAGDSWVYRASAIPCLLAAGALGLWLAARLRRRGAGTLAQAIALLVCTANPLTIEALQWGHPEEILGAALCAGAVLAALEDRPVLAGALLGLAIGNKQWAVLGIGPVLAVLPRQRVRAMALAGVLALGLLGPFAIAGNGGVAPGVSQATTSTGSIFQRWQIWWFLGAPHRVASIMINNRSAPSWLSGVAHPLIVALVVPLTALYCWIRRPLANVRSDPDALLLLALLLLLRCILDPWDFTYYPLPFLLALAAWEASRFRRPPVTAALATVLAWLVMYETGMPIFGLPVDIQALIFLLVSVSALAAIAIALYRPERRQTPQRTGSTAPHPARAAV